MSNEQLTSSPVCYGCDKEIAEPILCEGCGDKFCYHCYLMIHWCGTLTDIHGVAVKVGQRLRYFSRPRFIYEVLEMPRLYTIGGACLGKEVGKRDKAKIPIRPRLMELVSKE